MHPQSDNIYRIEKDVQRYLTVESGTKILLLPVLYTSLYALYAQFINSSIVNSLICQFISSSIFQFVNLSIRQFVNSSIRQLVNFSIRQFKTLLIHQMFNS